MSLNEAGRSPANSRWRNRVVIVAAAIVFGGFVAVGAISPGYGLLGFVILVLAALLANRATEEKPSSPVFPIRLSRSTATVGC
jgi:hypothetical protein